MKRFAALAVFTETVFALGSDAGKVTGQSRTLNPANGSAVVTFGVPLPELAHYAAAAS